jgi:hypothetical protein
MVKLLFYIAGGIVAVVAAVVLITRGPAPGSNPAVLFAYVVLFAVSPIGAFWMLYMSIRHEKNPFPFVLLSLIPFTFLWYYFERHGQIKREAH